MTQPASKRLLTEARAAFAANTVPVQSGTAASGSSATVSRSDHVHPSAGLYTWWGTATDGDLLFDGTTTVTIIDPATGGTTSFVPAASVYTVTTPIAARTITIGNGVTIKLDQGCVLMAKELITCPTGTCIISADGNAGLANGTAGAVRAASMRAATGAGGAGNTGAGSNPTATGGITDQWCSAIGGAGGLGPSGAGGGTFGASIMSNVERYLLYRDPRALLFAELHGARALSSPGLLVGASGGGGGGGDATNKGGGGGGGAGIVIVNARKWVGNITCRAIGGAGGSPATGNAGGGGGGGGGYVLMNSIDFTGYTGPNVTGSGAPVAGGAAGVKIGTGVNGTAGGSGIVILTTWT